MAARWALVQAPCSNGAPVPSALSFGTISRKGNKNGQMESPDSQYRRCSPGTVAIASPRGWATSTGASAPANSVPSPAARPEATKPRKLTLYVPKEAAVDYWEEETP